MVYFGQTADTPNRPRLWLHSLDSGESRQLFQANKIAGNAILVARQPMGCICRRLQAVQGRGRNCCGALAGRSPASGQRRVCLAAGGTWNTDERDPVQHRTDREDLRTRWHAGARDHRRPGAQGDRALPASVPSRRTPLLVPARVAEHGWQRHLVGSLETRPEAQDARRVIATRAGALYMPGGERRPWPAAVSARLFGVRAAVRRGRAEAGGRSDTCSGARRLQRRPRDQIWARLRIARRGARLS